MNESMKFSNSLTKTNTLLEKIATTCDALISALEYTTEAACQYGGGILHHFESEYVDVVVSTLLQLKAHIARLAKELDNGLIQSTKDLLLLVEGMQDIEDKLTMLLRENGNLRSNFAFWFEEIRSSIQELRENIVLL